MSLIAERVSTAGELGFSEERLRRVDALLDGFVERGVIAGAVTLIGRNGRFAHIGAYGQSDKDNGTSMRPDHLCRLASMTKPVISVAVLMLLEEGKILLNEPVSAFVPSFANQQVQRGSELVHAFREITIRDLLTHTAGMGSATVGPHFLQMEAIIAGITPASTLAERVALMGKVPLNFQPGTAWEYSGMPAFDTLARICEVVSGQTIDGFLRERLFEPLGMLDTTFTVAPTEQARVATVYNRNLNGLQTATPPPFLNLSMQHNNRYFSGGGGLVGTAQDYGRFALMLGQDGSLDGERILGRKTVALMASNHIGAIPLDQSPIDLKGYRFGLGVKVLDDPAEATSLASRGTFGWSGFYGTQNWIDPVEHVVGVLLLQRMQEPDLDPELRTLQHRFQATALQALD